MIVDGVWKAQKNNENVKDAAYGWVLLEKGNIKARGMKKICANSPRQVEAYELLYGIIEVHKRGLQTLEIWSDAKNIVEGCKIPLNTEADTKAIIMDILFLLDKFSSIISFHIPRSKVCPAHFFAVEARKE